MRRYSRNVSSDQQQQRQRAKGQGRLRERAHGKRHPCQRTRQHQTTGARPHNATTTGERARDERKSPTRRAGQRPNEGERSQHQEATHRARQWTRPPGRRPGNDVGAQRTPPQSQRRVGAASLKIVTAAEVEHSGADDPSWSNILDAPPRNCRLQLSQAVDLIGAIRDVSRASTRRTAD